MKRFAVVLALLVVLPAARAQGPDDQYISIYNLIREADKLNSDGQPSEALPKYVEAQKELLQFQKGYPDWNPRVITFRLNYVTEKIAALSAKLAPPATNAPSPAPGGPAAPPRAGPVQPGPPSDWANQLNALKDQVRQLQEDKSRLEAKLKEALAVRPAAVDPRELAKAEEKIKSLQKENDLLKVNMAQEKAKPLAEEDTKALEETRQALAEANRKLAEQTKAASALALEKTALQNKLNNLTPAASNAAELEAARKALQEANLKLAEQAKTASGLAVEKEALQTRVKTLSADAEAAAALRTENQVLKKQLADLKAAPPATTQAAEASRQLAQARAQVAALQSDKDLLELEKQALENRVKQFSARAASPPATPPVTASAAKTKETSRLKQLERERDDLKKQLAAANKELYSRKSQAAAARVDDLQNQLTALRVRIDVFEARAVPYTEEELALFKKPETNLAQPEHRPGQVSVKELPPGTVALVAEAQRDYANKQLDKAEEKYLQVLQQDKNNVPALANLAAIQLDLNHLQAAEINIKQAVALATNDSYSFFVLGRLRFQQKKYDEAIEAFGRAAKLDPQDPQVENFLGLALSEKGLRGPAETALRKAIQLDPGYANAHNNLAVVYISQDPPLVELARWHYQKALAAGEPRNPALEKMLDAKKAAPSGQ